MSEITERRVEAMLDLLDEKNALHEGVDEEHTDPECWRSELLESAFAEACQMVTEASMAYDEAHGEDHDELHPMDAVAADNLRRVHATGEPWRIPTFIVELDETPAYIDHALTENREVWSRRKPGLSSESTYVRIQVR